MMKTPFLIGRKIYLKGLTEDDVEGNWFQWFNDYEVCKHNNHFRFPNTKNRMLSYLKYISESNEVLVLGIIDKKSDIHIGNISLQRIDWINRSAELAIIIGEKTYWKKDIGFEAGKLLIEHGFKELNLIRIYCGTSQNNNGMQKLAVKLGMEEEGRQRKAIYKNGKYLDNILYAITKNIYYEE